MTNITEQALEVLYVAEQTLDADPATWMKGSYGYGFNPNGTPNYCGVESPNASCFCAVGAIRNAQSLLGFTYEVRAEAERLFLKANKIPSSDGIEYWNDRPERTYEDVMNGFENALELAASRAK